MQSVINFFISNYHQLTWWDKKHPVLCLESSYKIAGPCCINISESTYPYENLSSALHLAINVAAKPARRAVQSKNMWNESEMRPKLKYYIGNFIILHHDELVLLQSGYLINSSITSYFDPVNETAYYQFSQTLKSIII